ncbi:MULTISPECIES: hypothetical protein [Cysteiniphilum]|uniref:hypothetical protein n=1 Tax=Cysteiniphilum TaxID=2056696 RepID=UPI00177EAD15|nr:MULTISPECIES: hypothetical protein [Cysteiniphilum]
MLNKFDQYDSDFDVRLKDFDLSMNCERYTHAMDTVREALIEIKRNYRHTHKNPLMRKALKLKEPDWASVFDLIEEHKELRKISAKSKHFTAKQINEFESYRKQRIEELEFMLEGDEDE